MTSSQTVAQSSLRVRLRRGLRVVHRWLGLTVGLYLAVIGATGSVLVFHAEINALSRPAPTIASVAPPNARLSLPSMHHPLSEIRGILFARYGAKVGSRFTTFQFPRGPDNLYTTTGKVDGQTVTLTIDLATGQIVQAAPTRLSPLVRVEDLHENLLRGAQGFAANGWASLAAAVLLVTGLILYWPAHRRPWRMPFRRGRRFHVGDWHAAIGVCTLALLLVNTLTGAALVFNAPVEHAVYQLTGTPPRPGPPVAPIVSTSWIPTLDLLLDTASAAAPDASVLFVTLPTRPQQPFYCLLQKPSGVLPYISVYVHPQTAAILRVDRDDSAPLGRRIMGSVPALHEGTWGGLPVKILYTLVGLAPLTLYGTGLVMYAAHGRRSRRRQNPRRGTISV